MCGVIAADVGVSLLVVANALRLLRATSEVPTPKDRKRVGERMAEYALAHGH